jgi:hypothetical protein
MASVVASCSRTTSPPAPAKRPEAESARLVPFLYEATTYGYVTREGATAVPSRFRHARRFHEGRAAVGNGDHKWGFIDGDGTLVVPFRYDLVGDFHDGRARAFRLREPVPGPLGGTLVPGELTETTIDREGHESNEHRSIRNVLPDLSGSERPTFEELAAAPMPTPQRWATFSAPGAKLGLRELATGREVFPAQYGDIRLIEDVDGSGVKFFGVRSANDTKPMPTWTVYDLGGKELVAGAFEVGAFSSEGCFTISTLLEGGDVSWSAIDASGHRLVSLPYANRSFAFRDGIAEVWVSEVEPIFFSHDGRIYADMAAVDARHRAVGHPVPRVEAGTK